ncbi:Histone-lysine N-methyltransferase SETMAR [Eumeta japonica]|uniref:Histone-lysine N-methyltransferase SETMAR n=1 Tax=Eumeta variegata TaxID=151549 RepID=A0A4C1U2H7_EUMVA|nr:Histone-lysine N-methyltransferase SETMAR [Eumeta japonica]
MPMGRSFTSARRLRIDHTNLKRSSLACIDVTLITNDEKWITYDKNMRKRPRSKGKQAPQTIAKSRLTCNKLMIPVWWTWKSIIYHELLPPGETINSDLYCQQLKQEIEKDSQNRSTKRE